MNKIAAQALFGFAVGTAAAADMTFMDHMVQGVNEGNLGDHIVMAV